MSAKYVQFPLFLVRDIFENRRKTTDTMVCYGIYHYGKRQPFTLDRVVNCIILDCKENRLGKKLHAAIKLPLSQITHPVLTRLLQQNIQLRQKAIEYVSMRLALTGLNLTGNVEYLLDIAQKVKVPPKEPMPMINIRLLFDFRDHEKSEGEIAQLLAYIAIRSILGVKQCAKTNKALVLARMFGYSKRLPPEEERTPMQQKYCKRYHIDRLLEQLQVNWNVQIYSNHMRGFYVSAGNKMSLNDLVLKAEKSKLKNKMENLKNRKATALALARQQLFDETNPGLLQQLKSM